MAQMVKYSVKFMHRTAFTVQFPTHAYEVQCSDDIAIRCTPGDKMVRFYCVMHLMYMASRVLLRPRKLL